MKSYDGALWSPPSPVCEFTVDSATPQAPSVTITGKAPVNQGDPVGFGVSVGMTTPGFYDIDRFIYTTDGSEPQPQGSPSVPATQGTDGGGNPIATASISAAAVSSLQNYIKVKAVNKAGTPGPDSTCTGTGLDPKECFYVVKPLVPTTGLVAAWGLDDQSGSTAADTANTTPGNTGLTAHPATLVGGTQFGAGYNHGNSWTHPDATGYSDGVKGGLTLDGTSGYAQTTAPVIDTTKSFSVAAWVKLTDTGAYHTVVSQDSSGASVPILHYSKDSNTWAMSMATADIPQAPAVRAVSFNPPDLNVWTHLVGTFDASTGTLTLYVNGVRQHTAVAPGLASNGPTFIGAGKWNNNRVDYFAGAIDDVQVWQRTLSTQDAHDLSGTAVPLAKYNLAEGCATALTSTNSPVPSLQSYWAFEDGSGASVHDSSIYLNDATLTGGYSWAPGHTGGAVHLDGTTGFAKAGGPSVDTSNSFTVSAWAKLDDLNGYYAVMAQDGTQVSGFQLRYSKDVNRWIFGMPTADDGGKSYQWAIGYSAGVPQVGAWTLVTGVFDRDAMQIKLYVNGTPVAQVPFVGTPWNAAGSFSIGRSLWTGQNSGFFKGSIDQVQAWGRALTDDQIASLNGSTYLDTVTNTSATPSGGVALGADLDANGNPAGCAAKFDKSWTGQAEAPRPTNLRTDRSYTIEAWVKHTWTPADAAAQGAVENAARAAVGGNDAQFSPFLLGYRSVTGADGKLHGKWSFLVSSSATQTGGWTALSDGDVVDNTWVHLVGVYDAVTGRSSMYVNGVRQISLSLNTAPDGSGVVGWNSTNDLFIGRGVWTGQRSDVWYGGVAGVRVYAGVRDPDNIRIDKRADDPGSLFGIGHSS
ncbi:LamG domain-containing protein [Solihabitans fulvus]|uniref:LamG domain-containing protein n=1 Tax=Solihabitans fulvus TaxID=1892852 RepID=UPI001CB76375|nr:LamG domain-containing protein [Solihabitans fulvus]